MFCSSINSNEYSRRDPLMDLAMETSGAKRSAAESAAPDGSIGNPANAGEKIVTSEGNLTADVKKPSETGYAVSADGKTVLKSTGEVVSIREVASVKNGKMTLRLEDGSEVSSEDVSYASRDEALVYETVANMGVNASEANVLVNAFHTGNVDADTYTLGIQEAYRYGKYNYTVQEMLDRGSFASMLTEHQRKTAYKLGQVFSGRETAKAQAEVRSKQTDSAKNANSKKDSSAKKGGVMYESRDGSVSDLDSYLKDSGKELKPIQKTAIQTMKMLSDVFGIKFYVFESYKNSEGKRVWMYSSGKEGSINGYYDQSDGSIHIDLNAGVDGKGTMLFTMAHELTHFIKQWSPAKFKVLANFLMKQYGEKGVSVDALVRRRMKKTGLGYDAAYEEVVANSMESMLSDGNVTEKLAELKKQDRGLWNKIRQFINSWVDKLRAAYKCLTPDSEEGQTVYDMKDAAERLQALFAEALADAGENYQAAGKQKNSTREGDEKFSFRDSNTGMANDSLLPYSDEITNIIEKSNGIIVNSFDKLQEVVNIAFDEPSKKATAYFGILDSSLLERIEKKVPNIPKDFNGKIFKAGREYSIAASMDSIRHLTDSKGLTRDDVLDYLDRMADTIIENDSVAFDYYTDSRNNKLKGLLFKKTYSDGTMVSFEIISARKMSMNMQTMYMDAASYQKKKSAKTPLVQNTPAHTPEARVSQTSTANIAQPEAEVNEKFSMREPVEYTKDLVALHNLTEDKLAKALELGGFPMPSIAVTKSDIPHTNFGDITLVFGRETIDPKESKKNTVYSADAWTPTFPRVEYEENRDVGNRISGQLDGISKKVDEFFQRDLRMVYTDLEGNLNRYGGEEGLIQHAMENYGLKAAYLEEQGKHIEQVTAQAEADLGFNPESAEKYRKIMDILGVSDADAIGNLNLKETREKYGAELEKAFPGITKSPFRMSRIFSQVQKYLNNKDAGPVYETVTDENATKKAVDDALDMEDFEAWTRNLFSGIEKDSGIYNQKDIFTPSGNRRSFQQTHLPFTLDNIVKAMAAQNGGNTKNVAGFNGIKTLRAGTAERFKSIADMHKRDGRLQNLTEEQLRDIQDSLQSRLYSVMEAIDKENGGRGESNSLIRYDSIGEIIMEISEGGKYNVADIQNVFRQYTKEISDDTALEVKQLLYDVSQMPVNIFEAKPERAVRFDEVKAAILPKGTDQRIVDGLTNNGVPVQFYESGNNDERLQIVNSMDNLKFSEREDSDYDTKTKSSDYSYDSLISKPDMVVTTVDDNVPKNRADVVYMAKQNAAKVGKFDPKTGSVTVHVKDIDQEIILGTPGLKHGLDRRLVENAPVVLKAGEILQNSIRINELTPQKSEADASYVLIGAANNTSGDLYIVRSVVNRFSNELTSMDVLYAVNAKKGNRLRSMRPGFQGPVTDSTISIAELLDYVNKYFPDILPESVLKHYGYDSRPDGKLGESALYQERPEESVSNRSLLANALESTAKDDTERKKIREYKEKIELLNAEEQKLQDLNAQVKELSFAKGPRDKAKIRALRDEAVKTANRINTYDSILLRLEASQPLQNVLEREKKAA